MIYSTLKSKSFSKEEAYNDLLEQIKSQKKDSGPNQYYEIIHTIAFSNDDKKTPMYCFSTTGRNSNKIEF